VTHRIQSLCFRLNECLEPSNGQGGNPTARPNHTLHANPADCVCLQAGALL
jgi:hypothetical protein